MPRRLASYFRDATIVLGISLLTIVAIELGVRQFSSVQLIGIDSHLFAPDRFGTSYGNAPSSTSVAFEEVVHIDRHGYRVPHPDYRYPSQPARRILFIGDSVTFGVGVREEDSFVGLLRKAYPTWSIENASAAGYSPLDYLNVVSHILDMKQRYDDVVIVICLNDILYYTAANIKSSLERGSQSLLFKLKNFHALQAANDFVKNKLKLYLLIKSI